VIWFQVAAALQMAHEILTSGILVCWFPLCVVCSLSWNGCCLNLTGVQITVYCKGRKIWLATMFTYCYHQPISIFTLWHTISRMYYNRNKLINQKNMNQ
jgi:hypothetical protein